MTNFTLVITIMNMMASTVDMNYQDGKRRGLVMKIVKRSLLTMEVLLGFRPGRRAIYYSP